MKLRIPQKEHVVGTVEKMATINIVYTEIRVIMQFHCGNRGLITVMLNGRQRKLGNQRI